MNRIFKLVFNASRNKMMVVNEATSSTQVGKKASITVAVIAALASGAVCADPVSLSNVTLDNSVFGVKDAITTGKHELESTNVVLSNITATKGLTLAGGANVNFEYGNQPSLTIGSATGEASKKIASSITISDSKLTGTNYIIGAGTLQSKHSSAKGSATYYGSKVELNNVEASDSMIIGGGKIYNVGLGTMKVTNTEVQLTGKTTVNTVIGGSLVSGAKAKTTNVQTDTTNIYLGQGVKVTGEVIGGHYSNYYGKEASVESTNIVVDGADLSEATIIGGSKADAGSKATAGSMVTKSKVESSNISIKNSTVGEVYAGNYTSSTTTGERHFNSTASKTNVSIENSTVKGDVVGGSFANGKDVTSSVTESVNMTLNGVIVEGDVTSDSITLDAEGNKQFVENNIKNASMALTNVQANEVKTSKGELSLRAEGDNITSIKKLTMNDGVKVSLSTDGAANDAANGDIKKAIQIANGEFEGSVSMDEGMYQGAVVGTIKNGVTQVKQESNSLMTNILDLASSQPLAMNRILMNDVRKRLGDIRSTEETHGVWARYDGGKLSGSHEYKNDFTTLQFGVDTVPEADAPRFGVSFAYTKSDADLKRGSADMDAYSLAFYGTKTYDSGLFVDVIGRMAKADTDVVVDGNKKGSLDNVALSVSGELGWRFDVMNSFFVEPQTELTYTYIDSDQLTLNSGHEYELDSVNSLIGRVGFVAGLKCPADKGNVYVRASAVHEFMGDTSVRGGTVSHEVDGKDTWIEYGIGANFNMTKNAYVWADVERTGGATLDEDWRATVGVRYAW